MDEHRHATETDDSENYGFVPKSQQKRKCLACGTKLKDRRGNDDKHPGHTTADCLKALGERVKELEG